MKLIDKMNGPIWIVYGAAIICAVISVIFISGNGSGLIAGYNTASEAEKGKYDKTKLCRVVGGGTSVVAVLLLIMAVFCRELSADFIYVFAGGIIVDVAAVIVLVNTVCKK